MRSSKRLSLAMTAFAVGQVNAQQAASCNGPGAAFGITSYQCASCLIKQSAGTRSQYVFQAEPVVLETSSSSVFKPGDVIEAVNGDPILTQAGADRFTYPPSGATTFTVRRGNSRKQLSAATLGCIEKPAVGNDAPHPIIYLNGKQIDNLSAVDPKTIERIEVLKGSAASAYGDAGAAGVIQITTKSSPRKETEQPTPGYALAVPKSEPLYIVDGVVQPSASQVDMNLSVSGKRFGFAIGCVPSCTRAKASDGTEYFVFDNYPSVVALTPGGPAERAGIRLGDIVTQIDGKTILGDDGALRFIRGNKTETLHVTVTRGGSTIGYLLTSR